MGKSILPPLRPLSKRQRETLEEVRRAIAELPRSPCIDQTEKDVEAYYRTAEVGAVAVVRQTQYHRLQYTVTSIGGTPVRAGRVYIENFGAFYMKSGKNCFHPTGQTRLVVPTEQVLAWAAAHPNGETDIRYWRDGEGSIL